MNTPDEHPREAHDAESTTPDDASGGRPAGADTRAPRSDTDTIVTLLLDWIRARLAVGRTTVALAAAEARLATISLVLLVAAALLVVALLFVSWLLLLALFALGLQALGWSPALSVLTLLLLHLVAVIGLGVWIARLTRHLGFRQTREALRRRRAVHDAAT